MKNKKVVIWILTSIIAINGGVIWWANSNFASTKSATVQTENLKMFTEEELKKYDGTDPNLPIYIGMEGLVYDVSEGREYYQTDGVYHYLAGKDSTTELKIAGGGIIKRKYKVIGKLAK